MEPGVDGMAEPSRKVLSTYLVDPPAVEARRSQIGSARGEHLTRRYSPGPVPESRDDRSRIPNPYRLMLRVPGKPSTDRQTAQWIEEPHAPRSQRRPDRVNVGTSGMDLDGKSSKMPERIVELGYNLFAPCSPEIARHVGQIAVVGLKPLIRPD